MKLTLNVIRNRQNWTESLRFNVVNPKVLDTFFLVLKSLSVALKQATYNVNKVLFSYT